MVRSALVLPLILLLMACEGGRYDQPIALTPHGAAVRANMKAHIINPHPRGRGPVRADGVRAAAAVQAWREGTAEEPEAQSTSGAVN